MMIKRDWTEWDWQKAPDAPRDWADTTVVLVKKQEAFGKCATGLGTMADRAMLRLAERGGVGVVAYDLKELRLRTHDVFPGRIIPALCIERQKDLTEQAVQTICCIQACHRAILVTPREPIAIGLLGTLPKAWGIGYKQLREFVELVIVRGPRGDTAWPMHPRWVEKLRDECKEADVAFAFIGWGEWAPRTKQLRTLDPAGWIDCRRIGEHGRDLLKPGNATDDMGDDVIMQRLGARRAGRELDGQEHLAVPDALDPDDETDR